MHLKIYVHQKYIKPRTQYKQEYEMYISILYTPVRVPGGHCKTKCTSSSNQVTANQKYIQL